MLLSAITADVIERTRFCAYYGKWIQPPGNNRKKITSSWVTVCEKRYLHTVESVVPFLKSVSYIKKLDCLLHLNDKTFMDTVSLCLNSLSWHIK